MARLVGGEIVSSGALVMAFHVKVGDTLAVGDLCALDTTANFTVCDTLNDTAVLGRILAIEHTGAAGIATADTIATVHVFGFTSCVALATNAAIAVGVTIQTNVNGSNNIETAVAANLYNSLVVSDPGGAGDAYVLV